ncbi:MAG: hypothetical protein V7L22_05585 [Nostoc sp.]|uniref:hypothetical protein n=1 Tax=unclassified Nostoc TaxID=2593658 RepID=UPI0015C3981C|nr:hypothetical protein [Nostoc sp. C052]
MKVFHERVSFFYLAQKLHNLYISSPSLYTDRFIGVVYRRRHRFHETASKTIA